MLWLKEIGTDLVVPVGDGEYFLLRDMAGREVVLNCTVGLWKWKEILSKWYCNTQGWLSNETITQHGALVAVTYANFFNVRKVSIYMAL